MQRSLHVNVDSEGKARSLPSPLPSPRHFSRITRWMKDSPSSSPLLEESDGYLKQVAVVKETQDKIRELTSLLEGFTQSVESCVQKTRGLKTFLTEWSLDSLHPPDLSNAFLKMGNTFAMFGEAMSLMKEIPTKHVVEPLTSFLQADYTEFERSKKQYDKSKQEYESVLAQASCDAENRSASSIYEYECIVHDAKTKYTVANEAVADYLAHLQSKKDIIILESTSNMLKELSSVSTKVTLFKNENSEFSSQIDSQLQQRKSAFSGMKKGLADERSKKLYFQRRSRYHAVIKLLSEHNLELVGIMSDITGKDDFLVSSVKVLDGFNISIQVIQSFVASEVQKTTSQATLFRGNSINTRFINMYCKMVSIKYIGQIIGPTVARLIHSGARSYEIDPTRSENAQERERNTDDLINITEEFIQRLITEKSSCPVRLRYVLSCLRAESMKKFPESKLIPVSAFLFLRLLGPVFMAPEAYGIMTIQPTPNIRRALLLVAKIVQNLGNKVLFGEKEEYMLPFNPLLSKYMEDIQIFLENITIIPDHSQESSKIITMEDAELSELPYIHKLLVSNLPSIEERLSALNKKDFAQELASKLGSLGRPKA